MWRVLAALSIVLLILSIVGCGGGGSSNGTIVEPDLPPPGEVDIGTAPPMPTPALIPNPDFNVQAIASGLVIPWDMAFPSAQRIYVTERPGRVRLIENGTLRSAPYATINVAAVGEGGLLGIALDPGYPNPRFVYVMYTYSSGGLFNRISRFTDTGSGLTNETILVQGIPGASNHDGGALRFGPDGMLYAGTGDAGVPESAQDKSSLGGKILRITPSGGVPGDNPFPGSRVYALGFRNVQGLAWNPANEDLWATNHGPSANDSVFIVERGGNHGWPRVLGVTDRRGVVDPVLFFPNQAVPPSGATFYDSDVMPQLQGDFFFASLGAQHLQRVVLSGPRTITQIERWFTSGGAGVFGRLRAVHQSPDGFIYISTSNGSDDKIIRISPR